MNVRTLILAILNFQEASGYEIRKMSSEGTFSFFIDISYGSIYPTLARLEGEGMVECRAESHAGKPDRKVYTITDKGRLELVRGLSQPPQKDIFKSEFLLLAMNADLVEPEIVSRAVAQRIEHLQADLDMIDGILGDCEHPATCWVAGYAKKVMETDIAYLREHQHELIEMPAATQSTQAAE